MISVMPRSNVLSLLSYAIVATGFLAATGAGANTYDTRPKIFIHLKPVTSKDACDPRGQGYLANCDTPTVTVKGKVTPIGGPDYYYAYLVAARFSERPHRHSVRAGLSGPQGFEHE